MASDPDQNVYSEEDSLVQHDHHDNGPVLLNDVRKESPAKILGICYICCLSLALSPGIIAIVIAADSNITVCAMESHHPYIIALDVWLYVAGCTSMVVILVYIFINCYLTFFASLEMYARIVQLGFSRTHFIVQAVLTTFHTVWAIIGIYMYSQMESPCLESEIGTMILIFAILELLMGCCVSCVMMVIVTNDDRSRIRAVDGIGLNFHRYNTQNDESPQSIPNGKS